MLIGATGGGKSVIINTMVKAQHEMGLATKLIILNPKVRKLLPLLRQFVHCILFNLFEGLFDDRIVWIFGSTHRQLDGRINSEHFP